jgi:multiple antibiotic resistance protein
MLEVFVVSFTTFFATIGPLDVVAIFAALTGSFSSARRRSMAIRGTAIAACILLCFAFLGEWVLSFLGISLPALRVSGGILLLLIGIDMVFARSSGGTSTTIEEENEAASKDDISVFPLATPLIAGPGTMGAVILLMSTNDGLWVAKGVVVAALLSVLLLTLCMLLLAGQVQRLLGVTGMQVVSRVFGVILAALAVQFIMDGLSASGLF